MILRCCFNIITANTAGLSLFLFAFALYWKIYKLNLFLASLATVRQFQHGLVARLLQALESIFAGTARDAVVTIALDIVQFAWMVLDASAKII